MNKTGCLARAPPGPRRTVFEFRHHGGNGYHGFHGKEREEHGRVVLYSDNNFFSPVKVEVMTYAALNTLMSRRNYRFFLI